MTKECFSEVMRAAALRLLKLHFDATAGHIGGNLSSLDVMVYLQTVKMSDADLFVLSKGHSAGALYVSLWAAGKLKEEDLKTYTKDGSFLAAHPASNWHPSIPFMTGSLGHGISLAAGVALGWKRQARKGRIYCLMSDGELQEGSCWEAFVFSVQNGLDNLTILVDHNGLQGFGSVSEVAAPMLPLADKFNAFGLPCQIIDGHSFEELESSLDDSVLINGPQVVILRTIKGNGIPFMANKMEWHYLPMNDDLYNQAVNEVNVKEFHAKSSV